MFEIHINQKSILYSYVQVKHKNNCNIGNVCLIIIKNDHEWIADLFWYSLSGLEIKTNNNNNITLIEATSWIFGFGKCLKK